MTTAAINAHCAHPLQPRIPFHQCSEDRISHICVQCLTDAEIFAAYIQGSSGEFKLRCQACKQLVSIKLSCQTEHPKKKRRIKNEI